MSVTVGLIFIGLLIFLGSALIPVDDRPKTWFDGSSVIIAIVCYIVGGGMSPARYVRQPHFCSTPDAVNREVGAT